jgi:hypothetical protein
MRPYDQELVTCKRYWEKSYSYATALGTNTTNDAVSIAARAANATSFGGMGTGFRYQISKRSAPTVNFWSTIGTANTVSYFGGGSTANSGISTIGIGENGVQGIYSVGGAAGLTAGQAIELAFHYTADARL